MHTNIYIYMHNVQQYLILNADWLQFLSTEFSDQTQPPLLSNHSHTKVNLGKGPSAPETGFPPRYASQKAAPSLVPRKSPLRSCSLGCPSQRCHSEVPFHPSSSGLTLGQSLQWLLPQTLFPISAGKIPYGIIRDLTRFEELVVIFMVSAGLSLRKKGHDLLLQSPGQEKKRKWPGITGREMCSR